MPVILTLTNPEVKPQIITTDYRLVFMLKDVEQKRFLIRVRGTNGESKEFVEEDDAAISIIRALNKRNNSLKSEEQFILEKLITDGKLQGTVSGVPD